MKNKNKKANKIPFTFVGICFVIGLLCGIVMSDAFDGFMEGNNFLLVIGIEIALFLVAYCLHLIIHEAGHLVAGLISGYGFGSFRVGNLMFIKDNGKIKIKKHTVAGTGGQCLMVPPKMVDGKFPVIFYNLGGVLMNLLFSVVFVLLAKAFDRGTFGYAFSSLMALAGFITALTNGIPLKLGMINNDGSNARELYKNEEAMRTFHNQFMTVAALGDGKRLCEMPEDWFFMPSESGLNNSITISGAVFRVNWLLDRCKREEALELINYLLVADSALIGLHRYLLTCDKITILLLQGDDDECVVNMLSDKQLEVFFKQMKNNISVVRTQYAIALLLDNDENKAKMLREHFEKCAETHPYPSELKIEREMMDMMDKRAENK